jgi:hypothetical protein
MQTAAVKKMELINQISRLPEQKIVEVEYFIQQLLAQLEVKKSEPISLKGIWKNKGFEKIVDLETEIKNIRQALDDSLLKKAL